MVHDWLKGCNNDFDVNVSCSAKSAMSDDVWADAGATQPRAPQMIDDSKEQRLHPSLPEQISDAQRESAAREAIVQAVSILRMSRGIPGNAEALLDPLISAYTRWIREPHQLIDDNLWFQLAEIAGWLAISRRDASFLHQFKETKLLSIKMPSSDSFCESERHVSFTLRLFDSLCGPVAQSAQEIDATVANTVVEVFVSWMMTAMRGIEFVFLSSVGHRLVGHIQDTYRGLSPAIVRAAHTNVARVAPRWKSNASSIAVAALLVHSGAASSALNRLEVSVARSLTHQEDGVFPHIHRPAAIVAAALSVATPSPVSPSSVILCQFVALRTATLGFVSPRLTPTQQTIEHVQRRYLESLERGQLSEQVVTQCLEVMDACRTDVRLTKETNAPFYTSMLHAMQARSETALFHAPVDQAGEIPAEPVLAAVYDVVRAGVRAFVQSTSSSAVSLRCFQTLVQFEFARESCPTPTRNELIVSLTQRVEDLMDAAPDATISALADMVRNDSMQRDDVAFGWTCLALGQTMQRKLRTVLFNASEAARRDVLALVFAGLYHDLEPLNEFVHRFLSFTLASLGQFVSVYEVFPFYLQESLRLFPKRVTKEQAASAIGTIFGALYYTQPVGTATSVEETRVDQETRRTMIMWALCQCRARVVALLPAQTTQPEKASGLYLAELFLELAKMAPIELLPSVAMEMEALVADCAGKQESKLLQEVKTRVFNAVALNCEAEKRAWFAAWYLELSQQYPSPPELDGDVVTASADPTAAPRPPAARL